MKKGKLTCLGLMALLAMAAALARGDEETEKRGKHLYASPPPTVAELVGVWQAAEMVAAGWNTTYLFRADGTFRRNTSQMDGETRLRAVMGRWRLEESRLLLTIEQEEVWEGGRLEPALGSVSTPNEIVDAKLATKAVAPPRTESLELKSFRYDRRVARQGLGIQGVRFWKYYDKPEEFPVKP
jgi:hypothetical protein